MRFHLWVVGFAAFTCMPLSAYAEPTTFEQALTQAYETNPTLQAERAKLRETDEQVSQALSNWRPDIEATANAGVSNQSINDPSSAPIPSSSNGLTPRSAGLSLTQPLFRGFRTVSATRAAEKQVAAERAKQCLCKHCRRKSINSQTLVGVEDGNSNALQRALGRRIRELRSERGYSQEGFADQCGVHRTFMGTVERGESNLSFQNIARVATTLGISLSSLFFGLEEKAQSLAAVSVEQRRAKLTKRGKP